MSLVDGILFVGRLRGRVVDAKSASHGFLEEGSREVLSERFAIFESTNGDW
jgi:hypothetical protein